MYNHKYINYIIHKFCIIYKLHNSHFVFSVTFVISYILYFHYFIEHHGHRRHVQDFNLITLRKRLLVPQPSLIPPRSASGAGAPRWRGWPLSSHCGSMFAIQTHVRI